MLTLVWNFNTYSDTRSGAREERKREPRLNRGRARRCNRGRTPHNATVLLITGWEGAVSRVIRESEDLPGRKGTTLADGVWPGDLEDKKGNPRIDSFGPGIFLCAQVTPSKEV